MRGNWHIVAISVAAGALNTMVNQMIIPIMFIAWLVLLYVTKRLRKLLVIISFLCFLFFSYYIPTISNQFETPPNESIRFMSGTIKGNVQFTDKMLQFQFLDKQKNDLYLVHYYLSNPSQSNKELHTRIYTGAVCTIKGRAMQLEGSRNPGEFNYGRYLAEKGIRFRFEMTSLEDVQCEGTSPLHNIYQLQTRLKEKVSAVYSEHTSSWVHALVLGDDSKLSEETIDMFQRWSLSHLLAISGLHIGLIVGLLYFISIKLGILTKEKADWLMIVFLPIYAIIAGGEPSVWRASLMVLLFILLSKWRMYISTVDGISIVFILLIVLNPSLIYHVGFQFSFLVTFGILLSSAWIAKSPSLFISMLRISFISQMIILPLQFHYFYIVQPLSILLNVLIVPYFSFVVIPLMFILAIMVYLPVIPNLIDIVFKKLMTSVIQLINYIDQVANYPWIFGEVPFLFGIIYYAVFICGMMFAQSGRLKRSFYYHTMAVFIMMILLIRPYFSSEGTVTMLDVGQGDAFIIELPYRKGVIMIDAGATFHFQDEKISDKVYRQVLKPYLHVKGIYEIDAIFASHEHVDHVGSIPYLIQDFRVKQVLVSTFYPNEYWMKDVEIKRVKSGESWKIGDHVFNVLAPSIDQKDANENSLIIQSEFAGLHWLFMGDAGKPSEKILLEQNPNIPVDVLKIGHHGSKSSSDKDFINHVQPKYAFISAGIKNRYGHPAPEVIATLHEAGIFVFQTPQHGAVIYRYQEGKQNNRLFQSYLQIEP